MQSSVFLVVVAVLMIGRICRADDFGDRVAAFEAATSQSSQPPIREGCECGGPCQRCACDSDKQCIALSYYRYADGCTYEFRGQMFTGVAWDASGRKWVNGVPVNQPRAMAMMAACSS